MKNLMSLVADSTVRPTLASDAVELVELEVNGKTGLSGAAVKTVYKIVQKLKPGIVPELVDGLIDDFVARIQPFCDKWQETSKSEPLERYLNDNAEDVAESLLGVTDDRARRASNKTLVKAYEKLRPKGKAHVLSAVPRIAALIEKYTV